MNSFSGVTLEKCYLLYYQFSGLKSSLNYIFYKLGLLLLEEEI